MKKLLATTVSLFLPAMIPAYASETRATVMTGDNIRSVSPALERYGEERLLDDLWKRADLTPRDRSIVTVAALIARNQSMEMPHYVGVALDNGVKPSEISEIITHLAFYSGWANATAAVSVTKDIFAARGIGVDQLPSAQPELLPLDDAREARRAASVDQMLGPSFPGLVQYTTEVLFHDLWLRPALAPRDRSLVTISALTASGQFAQLRGHLNLGMDNGLTQEELKGPSPIWRSIPAGRMRCPPHRPPKRSWRSGQNEASRLGPFQAPLSIILIGPDPNERRSAAAYSGSAQNQARTKRRPSTEWIAAAGHNSSPTS